MTVRIFAHNPHSAGAKALSQETGWKRLKHEGSRWQPREGDAIVNWGSTRILVATPGIRLLNGRDGVTRASNKLSFFTTMASGDGGVSTPRWTTSKEEATEWVGQGPVVCRTVLNGHSGNGIIIAENVVDIVDAPLYTKYLKKQAEYRIHVVGSEVIDVQRKIRDPDRVPTDWRVRSHRNGFIFVRNDVEVPDDAKSQAIRAVQKCGLDFGAVDVITNRSGTYVLEINTAPGLVGTTVINYGRALRRLVGEGV